MNQSNLLLEMGRAAREAAHRLGFSTTPVKDQALHNIADDLLAREAEIIRADDTCIGGWIRILGIGEHFVVQEKIPFGDVLIRRLYSLDAAERFVEHRLPRRIQRQHRAGQAG